MRRSDHEIFEGKIIGKKSAYEKKLRLKLVKVRCTTPMNRYLNVTYQWYENATKSFEEEKCLVGETNNVLSKIL